MQASTSASNPNRLASRASTLVERIVRFVPLRSHVEERQITVELAHHFADRKHGLRIHRRPQCEMCLAVFRECTQSVRSRLQSGKLFVSPTTNDFVLCVPWVPAAKVQQSQGLGLQKILNKCRFTTATAPSLPNLHH
jgi:hypothetical protein